MAKYAFAVGLNHEGSVLATGPVEPINEQDVAMWCQVTASDHPAAVDYVCF